MASEFFEALFGGLSQGLGTYAQGLQLQEQQKREDALRAGTEAESLRRFDLTRQDRLDARQQTQENFNLLQQGSQSPLDMFSVEPTTGVEPTTDPNMFKSLGLTGTDFKFGEDARKASTGKFATKIMDILQGFNQEEFGKQVGTGTLPTTDPNILRSLIGNEFSEKGGFLGFGTEKFDTTGTGALLDSLTKYQDAPTLNIFNEISQGGTQQQGGTDMNTWGRSKYGNQWDEITEEQKLSLFNQR